REEQWIDGELVPYEHTGGIGRVRRAQPHTRVPRVLMEAADMCECGSEASMVFIDLRPEPEMEVICPECRCTDEYGPGLCPPEVISAVRASPCMAEVVAHLPPLIGALDRLEGTDR